MRWLRIPFYAVVCAAVFVFAACFTIKVLVTDESTVLCPDLTGLDVEEAKQLAVEKGLSLITGKHEKREDVPYNRVLLQTPDAGMPVRAGRTVTVVLSDGPVQVVIPVFVGLSLEAARAALADRGMKLKKVLYVPDRTEGRVVAQAPAGGENILDQEGVVLFVGGREKRFYVMPDVGSADYGALLQEMEEKHIKHVMASLPPGQPGAAANGALACNVPPGTIITEDDILELQANSGG
jgi:beta-lactam-binding protein with PASTA domain